MGGAKEKFLFGDDAVLLSAYRDGQREALECVYRTFVRAVDGYLHALAHAGGHPLLAQPSAIADLLQDVFIRAFSSGARNAYDGQRDLGPYLFAIARNCYVDALRAAGREVLKDPAELAIVVDEAAGFGGQLEMWCDSKTLGVVNAFLGRLPADLKGVYEQRFELGRSQEQASAELGLSRRAIRTAEGRLRKGLRRALVRAGIRLSELEGHEKDFPARIAPSPVFRGGRP